MAESGDDEVGGLGASEAAPGRVGLEDLVEPLVAVAVEGDEVSVGFVSEAGVAAMVQVAVVQVPRSGARLAGGGTAVSGGPGGQPLSTALLPGGAGHPGGVVGSAGGSPSGPGQTGPGVTHVLSVRWWRCVPSGPARRGGCRRRGERSTVGGAS